jgi:hypothetical protein
MMGKKISAGVYDSRHPENTNPRNKKVAYQFWQARSVA